MRIRIALVALAAAAVTGLSGCTYFGTNWHQWAPEARGSVQALSDTFDIPAFTYVGHDPDSTHASDFMLPGGGHNAYWVNRGWELAHFAQTFHTKLKVHYIVFRQTIWNTERASEGWRPMANRGNWTQNHMDHVHISYY